MIHCGCGTVDSAVASDTRRPGLESSHRQLLSNSLMITVFEKTKIKRNGTFKKESANIIKQDSRNPKR